MDTEGCVKLCNIQQKPIAVYFPGPFCYCDDTLASLSSLSRNTSGKNGSACHGKMYLTDWATKQCSYAEFLDPVHPKIPLVGLVTVPGSGNTWSRSLAQRLTGVLSGSVYNSKEVFNRGLPGEFEDWESGKTSFVKNHLFSQEKNSRGKSSNYFIAFLPGIGSLLILWDHVILLARPLVEPKWISSKDLADSSKVL